MSVLPPSLDDRDGKIWMDGELVEWRDAKIHVLTHTLHYGCGAFEGVRAYNTVNGTADLPPAGAHRPPLQQRQDPAHEDPLQQGAGQRGAEAGRAREQARELLPAPAGLDRLREAGRQPRGNKIHLMVAAWAWGAYLGEEGMKRGIRVKTSSYTRHHVNITMTQAKAVSNYSNSILANMEALDDGYDEALLLDASGFVSEGAGENLFVVKDGVVYTPDLSAGALNGITRNTILHDLQGPGPRSWCKSASRATRSTSPTRPSSPAPPPK
jgi:branched-chain amino acid aminotransferase